MAMRASLRPGPFETHRSPRSFFIYGLTLLPLFLGCAQVLGLDEAGTLRDDSGTGGASASASASGTSATTAPATVASATTSVTAAVSSSSTGLNCGPCPNLNTCEVAVCNGNHCDKATAPQGTPCTGGTCDGDNDKKCIPAVCAMQPECGNVEYCEAMTCHPKKAANAPCMQPFECLSNKCMNQMCGQ